MEKSDLLVSVISCQFISNVPSSILLSQFTGNYADLLIGVNIGGVGTLIASLASLITLKLYIAWPEAKIGKFMIIFTTANLIGLVIMLSFCFLYF